MNNTGDYRTLADNLSTSKNYTLAASPVALGLASNQRVTEIMFVSSWRRPEEILTFLFLRGSGRTCRSISDFHESFGGGGSFGCAYCRREKVENEQIARNLKDV